MAAALCLVSLLSAACSNTPGQSPASSSSAGAGGAPAGGAVATAGAAGNPIAPPLGGAAGSGAGSGNAGGSGVPNAGQAGAAGGTSSGASSIVPVRLRVELRDAPLAIQSATPRLGWELQSSDAAARGLAQSAYQILVASSADQLAADQGDLFDSGWLTSSASSQLYAGKPLSPLQHAYWKVRVKDQAELVSAWSAPSEFTVGLLAATDWGAQWIGAAAPLPIFRREFAVSKPVRRALISICGLGQFELRLNGANVSDAVMEPSWTNYAKTCQYAAYDVSKAVVQGQNAIGVLLGNGMYNVPASNRYAKFTGSFGKPKLILRLQLDYEDGTSAAIVSDASWKSNAGPITFSNIYGGEDFDASLEPTGWDKPGFADTAWTAAQLVTGTAPALVARSAPPVKVQQTFMPAQISQPMPGVFVYDLGQNFSGWPEIAVQGAAGKTLKLTPGELLSGGLVTQANVGSPVYFSYTLKGSGVETWHPRFSYTGFRYIQVEGGVPMTQAQAFPDRPQISRLTGQFIYASAERVGKFSSSDADLNHIHQLILTAIESNLQNVLTDCPQREKLGWLETAHLLAPSIMFNFDAASFYEKIVDDMADAQQSTGLVSDIAPEYAVFPGDFRDSPEWGSSFIVSPWIVFQMYGDSSALSKHYADMKRYEAYLRGKSLQSLLGYGLGDWYDVGPAAPGVSQNTTAGVTATALWLQDLRILEDSATVLGKAADATQFQSNHATISAAFNSKFLKAGSYDRGSQTALAMPLVLGLVPADQVSPIQAKLAALVTSASNRVTAGDIGFSYLLRALSEAGRGDVIYALLKQSTGPGYLYQLNHGATALTEAWDANPSSSQNHAMLGHAEAWLYNGLSGINPDPSAPGFAKIVILPQPQAGLDSVDAEYHSIRGLIKSSWTKTGAGFSLNVSIPVNTSATIHIPTRMPGAVTEGGAPAASAPGVVSHAEQASELVLVVGSGQYSFAAP